MIVGTRIDFRLIHGQVANLWANARQVERFLVVDDEVAEDTLQKQVLRMATPSTIRLSVLPAEKAAANILARKYDATRLFIVVKKPAVLVRLMKAGVKFDEIIVGNMTTTEEVRRVGLNIGLDAGDVEAFGELAAAGIPMVSQLVPSNNPEVFKL
ncbi:PTS sugar transporter subunit IIB [Collinsella sp. AGMB00827]|uniref:PTS sugar transporter subunit IIB n=1 Tax=Collinsella ureilytica TaxID=2869515 RepID=A0ABS7MJD4_9ACTN|nr:PTS sugar transporter subunit IIB [Collinsella urealyticum]